MNNTIEYYNNNVEEYVNKSHTLDMSNLLNMFLKRIPQYANILEIGTGSGRDAIYFSNHGCSVTTLEPSSGLTEKARQIITQESKNPQLITVINSSLQDFTIMEKYDAVYAMASLLHIPKIELKENLNKCFNALNNGGTIFANFKEGVGEKKDELGRLFSYYEKEELEKILGDIFEPNIFKVSFDANDVSGRNLRWLNVEIKKPELILDTKLPSIIKFKK